mgnify:FL=1
MLDPEGVVSHLPLSSVTLLENVKSGHNNQDMVCTLDRKKHHLLTFCTDKKQHSLCKPTNRKSQNLYSSHEEHMKELLFVFLSK